MNIYSELILDHYQNPRNFGKLKKPTKKTVIFNPSCGDRIELDIILAKNKIKDIKFRAQGCAISQASASMLTDTIKGKAKEDLQKLDKDFIITMLGVDLGPNRIKCALLPLEALQRLL